MDLKKRFSDPRQKLQKKKKEKRAITSGERKKKAWEEDGEIKGTTARLGFGDLFPISDSKDEKPI